MLYETCTITTVTCVEVLLYMAMYMSSLAGQLIIACEYELSLQGCVIKLGANRGT